MFGEHLNPTDLQINEGKLVEAEGLLDRVLEKCGRANPNLGALVARGTARALARELQGGFSFRIHASADLSRMSLVVKTSPGVLIPAFIWLAACGGVLNTSCAGALGSACRA